MESPYVNKNGQKLEEQMKPDAQITQKLDKTLFSLHSEKNKKLGNLELSQQGLFKLAILMIIKLVISKLAIKCTS